MPPFRTSVTIAFVIACVAARACAVSKQEADATALKQFVRDTFTKAGQGPHALSPLFHFPTEASRDAVMPELGTALSRWRQFSDGLKPTASGASSMPMAFLVAHLPAQPNPSLKDADAEIGGDTATLTIDYSEDLHFRRTNDGWRWDAAKQFSLDGEGEPMKFAAYLRLVNAALARAAKDAEQRKFATVAEAAAAVDRAAVLEFMRPHLTDRDDLPAPKLHADERRLVSGAGRIATMAASPDGKMFVTGAVSAARPLQIWDAATGHRVRVIQPADVVLFDAQCVRFLPDGKTIAAQLAIWDANELMERARSGLVEKPYEYMSYSTAVRLFDANTGEERPRLDRPADERLEESVAISRDGRFLAVTGLLHATAWDLSTRKVLPALPSGHAVAFTANSEVVLVPAGLKISIHDPATGRELRSFARSENRFDQTTGPMAVSPDGSRLAYGTIKGVVVVDTQIGRNLKRLLLPEVLGINRVNDIAYSADGSRILAAAGLYSRDDAKPGQVDLIPASDVREACVWDAASGKVLAKFDAYQKAVSAAAFVENETAVIVASTDGTVRLWKLPGK